MPGSAPRPGTGPLDLADRVQRSPLLGLGVALAAVAAATLLRFAIDHALPVGFPYLTYFPAVILTAFVGGLVPGAVCALLSGLAAWYWFIPPFGSFAVDGSVLIALLFYAFIVTVDILLIHFTQRAARRLAAERALTADLLDRQRVMFQELQHRVANNMQFVSSLLGLQKRKAARDPDSAAGAFDEARARIDTISRVHRRLYDPETVDQPVDRYLQELCDDVLGTGNAGGAVRCAVSADPGVRYDLRTLTTLSLIVVEALTNALKHAFHGRSGGCATVTVENLGDGRHRLVVADDGVGFDPAVDPAGSGSLGQRIIRSLAGQLDGEIRYETGGGTRMVMTFRTPQGAAA